MQQEQINRCFARRHFESPAIDSFYRYAYDVSHERDKETGKMIRGWFYKSSTRDAADYGHGLSPTTLDKYAEYLEKTNWFVRAYAFRTRKPKGTRHGGEWASTAYRVLGHDEFVAKYGNGQCRYKSDLVFASCALCLFGVVAQLPCQPALCGKIQIA